MTKIELTISPDYVPTWTITDAIRELFQNAVDQQEQFPDNLMSWDYTDGMLTISNKSSELTAKTLLLGSTTKANDKRTIGQFGEGYKIATLVLLRCGKPITFYNRKAHEIWRPRFVESKRFGAKILTFFIEKQSIWNRTSNDNLVIEIGGITEDEFNNEILPSNLHMEGADIFEHTDFGNILRDRVGQVFVNGLFVCNYKPYQYGYDFKPEYITLDRDRKMASDFDLKWLASRMWAKSENQDEIIKLINDGAADVGYIEHMSDNSLADVLFTQFMVKYGVGAIPVTSQDELDKLPPKYRGIIVSQQYKQIMTRASGYNEPIGDIADPLDKLDEWFKGIEHKLDYEDVEEFNIIYGELTKG